MKIIIQRTTPKEFQLTENLTRESFWNVYKPGCDEHLVLHQLRNSKSYSCSLDLVAILDNEVVGHIISSKAKIVDTGDHEHEVLVVGPLSVLSNFQNKGIGSQLMNHSIAAAREMGFSGMILFGNPAYYHRFGFRNAQAYGITTKEGLNFEPFMALELQEKGLAQKKGRFFEDPAFDIQPDDLAEFEKNFPHKEKLVTDTQLK